MALMALAIILLFSVLVEALDAKRDYKSSILLKFKEDANNSHFISALSELAALGGKLKRKYSNFQKLALVCFAEEKAKEAIAKIRTMEHIEYYEMDSKVRIMQVQKDAPWGLWRISRSYNKSNSGFVFGKTGNGVNVYILDSGVDSSHVELRGRVKYGANLVDSSNADCAGHGTQVASIVAGKNIGVAKLASIVSVKILDCDGEGTNSDLIEALHWVIKNHKKPAVINLSVGGPPSELIDEAVRKAILAGIPVVVAAGNSKEDACTQSPSNVLQAITVGASNQADERARFSNFGRCVDIFAPGVGVLCASSTNQAHNGYTFSSGTSMAAPFVTGVISQLLEGTGNTSVGEISKRLYNISERNALNPISLLDSPNLMLQSVPTYSKQSEKLVDVDGSTALPWRPTDKDLPEAIEVILISLSTLFLIPITVAFAIFYYFHK